MLPAKHSSAVSGTASVGFSTICQRQQVLEFDNESVGA